MLLFPSFQRGHSWRVKCFLSSGAQINICEITLNACALQAGCLVLLLHLYVVIKCFSPLLMFSAYSDHLYQHLKDCADSEVLNLNFLLSAYSAEHHNMFSFRIISPIFLRFPQMGPLSFWFCGHNLPPLTDEALCKKKRLQHTPSSTL